MFISGAAVVSRQVKRKHTAPNERNRRVIVIAVIYIVYQEIFSHGKMPKTYDIIRAPGKLRLKVGYTQGYGENVGHIAGPCLPTLEGY